MSQKIILFLVLFSFLLNLSAYTQTKLGQERIEPLRFPKFTMGGEFALLRDFRTLNSGSNWRFTPKNTWGFGIHAEAGLIKYLNAGVSVTFTASRPYTQGSNLLRLGLFLKPYLPLGTRFAFFTRLGLGGAAAFNNEAIGVSAMGSLGDTEDEIENIDDFVNTYGSTMYSPLGLGVNGTALIGFEVFVTSRIGIVGEYGIRADINWAKVLTQKGGKPMGTAPKSGNPAPKWFMGFLYDTPIILSMHIIL